MPESKEAKLSRAGKQVFDHWVHWVPFHFILCFAQARISVRLKEKAFSLRNLALWTETASDDELCVCCSCCLNWLRGSWVLDRVVGSSGGGRPSLASEMGLEPTVQGSEERRGHGPRAELLEPGHTPAPPPPQTGWDGPAQAHLCGWRNCPLVCLWGRGPYKLSCPQRPAPQVRSSPAQGRPPVETSYRPHGWSGRGPGLAAVTKGKVCAAPRKLRDDRVQTLERLLWRALRGLGQDPEFDEIYL